MLCIMPLHKTAITNAKGTSISDRPEDIDTREEYGNWEMDTVVGKQGTKTSCPFPELIDRKKYDKME